MGDITHQIKARFPDKKEAIADLMAEDADFCVVCQDYGACIDAYRYWSRARDPEAGTRASEYRDLIQALEGEIEEALSGPQNRQSK